MARDRERKALDEAFGEMTESTSVMMILGANEILQGIKGAYYHARKIPYEREERTPFWRYVRRD